MPLRQAYQKPLITRSSAYLLFYPWNHCWQKVLMRQISVKKCNNHSRSNLDPICSRIQGIALCYGVQKNSSCVHVQREAVFSGAIIFKKFCVETPCWTSSEFLGSMGEEELQRNWGAERNFKRSLQFNAEMTTLERHSHHWWHAKEKGDKLGKVQKRKNDLKAGQLTWETNSRNWGCSACQRKAY